MGTSSHLDSLFGLQGIGCYAITAAGTDDQRRSLAAQGRDRRGARRARPDRARGRLGPQEHHHRAGPRRRRLPAARRQGVHLQRRRGRLLHRFSRATATATRWSSSPPTARACRSRRPPSWRRRTCSATSSSTTCRSGRTRSSEPAAQGFDVVMATLSIFRVSVAGASLGLAQAALEEAARHAAYARAVRTSARPPRGDRRDARRLVDRARGRPPADLPRRRARPRGSGRVPAPLFDGEADGQRERRHGSSTARCR